MDFLEGFLLGPIWSDTEYETRRHTGFYWLIGWVALAVYIYLQLTPTFLLSWLTLPLWAPVLIVLVLMLISPFACRYYYRLNIVIKVIILAVQLFKLLMAFLAFYQRVLPLYKLNLDTLPQQLLDYVNQTVTQATETFTAMGQAVGMMVGILAGGLQVVLTFAGVLIAATLAPALFLFLIQLLQRGIDLIVHRTVLHNVDL